MPKCTLQNLKIEDHGTKKTKSPEPIFEIQLKNE